MRVPFLKAAAAAPTPLPAGADPAPLPPRRGREGLEAAVIDLAGDDDPQPVFVAAFGLDRFDRIRAALGYRAIDDLVEQIGDRLRGAEPQGRLGRVSDDVVALTFHAAGEADAVARVDRVRRSLQGAYRLGEHVIDVRLSVGLGCAGPPAALVRAADLALDAARVERQPLRVFDPQAHAAAADALALMPELRQALRAEELFLEHQPKIDLRTGEVAGVESLVRWRHPQRGLIPPSRFVPLSEETGDVRALTDWVLARALAEQERLATKGFDLPFAVNLSGRLLGDEAFIDQVVERAPSQPGRLRLEITETAVISDPALGFANVRKLSAAGIACSIDDYGAGLSSLPYLKQIEADELKLDKSLIDDVGRSRRDALVVRSTVELAHSLGMRVVAEGVETRETAAIVAAMGCDLAQGYFFSPPLALAPLLALLRGRLERDGAGPEAERVVTQLPPQSEARTG